MHFLQLGWQDCGYISSVLRTAFLSAPLWLWYACCEVCVDCCWKPQTEIPRARWSSSFTESHYGRQSTKILGTGKVVVTLSIFCLTTHITYLLECQASNSQVHNLPRLAIWAVDTVNHKLVMWHTFPLY